MTHFKTSYPDDGHINCFAIEDRSFWFQHRNNCIVEVIRNYPPNGVIYDIGGGNGFVTLSLLQNGFKSILVEPSSTGIKNAKSRGISRVINSTLEDANFKSNSLPAVGIFDVLEHMKDDKKILKDIYEVLHPYGKLFITIPAFSFLWSYQDEYAKHYRRYTIKSITALLRSAGFALDYSTYFFSPLFLPLFIFRTLPYRMKLFKKYTTDQFQKEMTQTAGLFSPLIGYFLKWELNKIKNRQYLPFGSSILVAAYKDN